MKILFIIISIAAIAVLGWLIKWDSDNSKVSLLNALFAAQVPSLITFVLIAYRSKFLSRNLVNFSVALRGHGLATVGTLLFPARLSEFGKPLYFKITSEFPISKGVVLVVEERIWDISVLALLSIFTLHLTGDNYDISALAKTSEILAVSAVTCVAFIILLPSLANRIPIISRVEKKYGVLKKQTPWSLFIAFIISIVIWVSSLAILIIAYQFSGLPDLRLDQLLFLFVASTLGLAVSITPGSLGTYEGTIVAVLLSYGVDWDGALAFAIIFRFSWLIVPLIVAVSAIFVDRNILSKYRNWKNS